MIELKKVLLNMTRPLRIEYPGALYHVTSRGNACQNIFLSNKDRLRFFSILADTINTFNWICYAYCLMENHYHIFIETLDGNLAAGMRQLNGVYTQYFNRTHSRPGHLFQGRYKAFLVEKESYLLQVARYIVLNPVHAGLTDCPEVWRWSSYRATVGLCKAPVFLTVDGILGLFSRQLALARREYRKFVRDGMIIKENPFDKVKHRTILGSPQFIDNTWEIKKEANQIKEIPREARMVGRPQLKDIFFRFDDNQDRNQAIVFARKQCLYSVKEIADYLGLHYSTASKVISKSLRSSSNSHSSNSHPKT